MTGEPNGRDDPDGFDQLAAAATRVLRAALQGSAALRAAPDQPNAMLRELERAVAAVLREAQAAADEIRARAGADPDEGPHHARPAPDRRGEGRAEERVELRNATPSWKREEAGDIVIRKSRRDTT